MLANRFRYRENLPAACSYREYRDPHWPPGDTHGTVGLDLAAARPPEAGTFRAALADLASAVEREWRLDAGPGDARRNRFADPEPVAAAMLRVAAQLPRAADRRATTLRAEAVRSGYDEAALAELRDLDEDVTVVAGLLSTFYGKHTDGAPTAFACRVDPARQHAVAAALATMPEVPAYLRTLHLGLELGELPAFGATRLFFMAGEGDRHPKHIAYFLPEDEGVKRSPFKKTYYFGDTHLTLLGAVSTPLAARVLDVGEPFAAGAPDAATIATLGVLGHEFGHSVHRASTRYRPLNAADRWASVLLQEVCADVFGALLLTEVWAERVGFPVHRAVSYYLAECLRYVNRGLGHFPDSDGMYLQLSYLIHVGALEASPDGTLAGDPEAVLAGLRSLARVLADAVLDGRAEPAVTLHETFGPPAGGPMSAVLERIADVVPASVEYLGQDLPDDVLSGT